MISYVSEFFGGAVNYKVLFVFISATINFAILVLLILYVRKNSYSQISVALAVPSILTILLSLANQNSVSSLRYALIALPVFIATADIFDTKKLRYITITSFVLLAVFTFFYSWGKAQPFDMGVPV